MQDNNDLPVRSHPPHYPPVEKFNRSVIIFLTVCSKDRKKIFAHEDIHEILTEAWSLNKEWVVGCYVLMPDHIHLFCAPTGLFPDSLKKWIKKWKSYVSRRWPRPQEHPVWQADHWDRQLRNGDSYQNKWAYVKNNPVRKGYCKEPSEWPYQGVISRLQWND